MAGVSERGPATARSVVLTGLGGGDQPGRFSYLSFADPVLAQPESRDTDRGDESAAHRLDVDSVIGLYPRGSACSVLYVDASGASESEPAEKTAVFRHVEIDSPPQALTDRFPPPGPFLKQLARLAADLDAATLRVIVSTGSGQRHAASFFANIVKPFLAFLGLPSYAVHETSSAESITTLTRDVLRPAALAGTPQLVLLLSGDGGIIDLLNSLLPAPADRAAYAKPQVALLPLGTGNALAHSSGLTSDRTLGLSALFAGRAAALPFFTARFDPPATPVHPDGDAARARAARTTSTAGAVVFSWALHAALVADSDTPAYRAHGSARFQLAAAENMQPAPHAYRGRLSLRRPGSRAWDDVPAAAHAYVLATLCARLERAYTVSPASGPLDGALRVVQVGAPIAAEDLTGIMMAGYDGGAHVRRAEVLYAEAEAVRLRVDEDDAVGEQAGRAGGAERWRRVCVDGKIFAVPKGGVVEVLGPRAGEAGVLDLVCLEHAPPPPL